MIGLALLFWGLGLVFVLIAIKPRALWWTMSSWAFRNPEANEPSDAAYGLQSVISGVAAVAAVVVGFVMLRTENPDEREARAEQDEATCEELVSEVEQAYDAGGVEAAEARAQELGVDSEVHEAPAVAVDTTMETTIEIPPEVWIYDPDLPTDEQLIATVGGMSGNSTSFCAEAARA